MPSFSAKREPKGDETQWVLALNDSISRTEKVTAESDVNLYGRQAFLGSRPGERAHHLTQTLTTTNVNPLTTFSRPCRLRGQRVQRNRQRLASERGARAAERARDARTRLRRRLRLAGSTTVRNGNHRRQR